MSDAQHESHGDDGSEVAEKTNQFQVIEGEGSEHATQETNPNTKEAELQAKRDRDARNAEDVLRRERDLEARAQIDKVTKETASQVASEMLTSVKDIVDERLNQILVEASEQVVKMLRKQNDNLKSNEEEVIGKLNEFITNATGRIESVIDSVRSDIEAQGTSLISSTVKEAQNSINQQISEVVALIREKENKALQQREDEARNAEDSQRRIRDQDLRNQAIKVFDQIRSEFNESVKGPEVAIAKTAATQLQAIGDVAESTGDIIRHWTERLVEKQKSILNAKSLPDAIITQRELMFDNVETFWKISSKAFSMLPKNLENLSK